MPFIALQNNEPFDSENLTEENRMNEYVCPICHIGFIPVIPKTDRIKHFRHKQGGKAHGEPDGPEHRAMKKAVKEGAEILGFSSDYEVNLIGDYNKITDVRVKADFISRTLMGYDGFAVECQCASMSIDEYMERNQAYDSFNLKPIWILGERYFNKEKIKMLVKQILLDFNFCSFYITDQFYVFDGEEVKCNHIGEIILKSSGYCLRKNPFEYEERLQKQNVLIKELQRRLRVSPDKSERKIEELRKLLEESRRKIKSQALYIQSLSREIQKISKKDDP
jgi:competence CoiA-like predicted nuclease